MTKLQVGLLAAVLAAPLAAQEPEPGEPGSEPLQEVFRMEELGPGLWAAVVLDRPQAYAFANSLVLITDEGVLVVDTQQSPSAAQALITEIRARTDQPVRWVVHTHWHGDHVYGNQAYRAAFPDVRFVGHAAMAREFLERTPERVRSELEELPPVTAQRQEWLETGVGPSGDSLTAEQRRSLEYSVRLRTAYHRELQGLELIAPDVTFQDELEIHLGGQTVRLLHVGPAHTEGDLVVHLPGSDVLAVGDLIEAWLPYADDGDLRGWAEALAELRAMNARSVVGSHATPAMGPELLEWQADFFRELVDAVDRAAVEGLDRNEAARAIGLDDYLPRFQALGVTEEAYRQWVADAVAAVWDRPRPPDPGPRAAH